MRISDWSSDVCSSDLDYLSTWFARRLGAPPKVDSLANLLRWLPKGPKKGLWPMGLSELHAAAEPTAPDPWAYHLTSLRNLHIHRQPVGLVSNSHWMEYKLRPLDAKARSVQSRVGKECVITVRSRWA